MLLSGSMWYIALVGSLGFVVAEHFCHPPTENMIIIDAK